MLNQFSVVRFPKVIAFALILGVLLPSACVLWFMLQAMQNERLAAQQRILDVYREQIRHVNTLWANHWEDKLKALALLNQQQPSSYIFYDAIERSLVSSLVVHDQKDVAGYPSYSASVDIPLPGSWKKAKALEFQAGDLDAAIVLYKEIAEESKGESVSALAYQALARCLLKNNEPKQAFDILTGELSKDRYEKSRSEQGRSITANALMQALDIAKKYGFSSDIKQGIERQLVYLVNDYRDSTVISKQRLFIMDSLVEYEGDFITYRAEKWANQYMSQIKSSTNVLTDPHLSYVGDTFFFRKKQNLEVWKVDVEGTNITALFSETFLQQELTKLYRLSNGVRLQLVPPLNMPSYRHTNDVRSVSIPVGEMMPGWLLSLYLDAPLITDKTIEAKIAAYLWIGVLLVVTIFLIFIFNVRYIFKQEKITQLKNDLMDTITHELKTPLSSIRMFVEILLNSNKKLDIQTIEYLHLIDKENQRLTRLIDKFLTFSRLDKKKQIFNFNDVDPVAVMNTALEPFKERCQSNRFVLELYFFKDLPVVRADFDLMVVVMTNLLENAYKYSEEYKYIKIELYASLDNVVFKVTDKGIGMSHSVSKKVFDRFYREDQNLTQKVDGCGLGLNIAKYIIDKHKGSITVESELGEGSVFTVCIPMSGDAKK